MSYAVETKKRKFHRILESLSKPLAQDASSTSKTTTKPGTIATPSELTGAVVTPLSVKKARLNLPSDDAASLAPVRSTVLKVGGASAARTTTTTTTRTSQPPALRPTFVPWDRERFLERLETFRRVDRWSPKPRAINEVAWAKRGWICTDVMRVSCVGGCGGSVVVKLPDELDELDGYDFEKVQERKEVRDKLVGEYEKLVVEGHGERCPWRNKGCDATIHRLPLTNTNVALANLAKRYWRLVNMGDKLPSREALAFPEGFDLDAVIEMLPDGLLKEVPGNSGSSQPVHNLPSDENQTSDPQTKGPPMHQSHTADINRTALALASFGWDTVSDGTAGLAECGACFRRLGLWLYKPKENGEVTVYSTLDVAQEHMEYCPWIDGEAQSGTGKAWDKKIELRAGWQLLDQIIRVEHRRRLRAMGSTDTLRTDAETRSTDGEVLDEDAQKASDREWWARLRRVRQVLTVKSPKTKKSVVS